VTPDYVYNFPIVDDATINALGTKLWFRIKLQIR
jgi:hypothetical protein